MNRPAALAIIVFLFFCAGPRGAASPDSGFDPSQFIERFTSLLDTAPEPPAVTEAEVMELEESDPRTYIFINRGKAHPPATVNLGGDGRLALTRQETGERITARYRNKDGSYSPGELAKVNRVMRCRLTGREIPVSIKLVEILDAVEDRFGHRGLTLLSGYRTPTLNRQVSGAARWSMHMLGWAADIRIPGHSPAKVAAYARKLGEGGVGCYPDAAFTHLDSGRRRHWVVRRSPALRPAAGSQAVPAK